MANFKSKWWQTMLAKYETEEGVRQYMREQSAKSNRNNAGNGGFAYMARHDPERHRAVSSKGGKKHEKNDTVRDS